MGKLGFVSPVKCNKSFDGYFLRSYAKVKASASDKYGGMTGNFIPCIDPGGVHKVLISDDKVVSGALRAVHAPLGDCL